MTLKRTGSFYYLIREPLGWTPNRPSLIEDLTIIKCSPPLSAWYPNRPGRPILGSSLSQHRLAIFSPTQIDSSPGILTFAGGPEDLIRELGMSVSHGARQDHAAESVDSVDRAAIAASRVPSEE